jgi:hypothetical protein
MSTYTAPLYALCRRVADGWLVLDCGCLAAMKAAQDRREAGEWHRDDNQYRVIHTDAAECEVVDMNGEAVYAAAAESDFIEFCRQRAARPEMNRSGRTKPTYDGTRQTMLLDHLDDLPGQRVAFE